MRCLKKGKAAKTGKFTGGPKGWALRKSSTFGNTSFQSVDPKGGPCEKAQLSGIPPSSRWTPGVGLAKKLNFWEYLLSVDGPKGWSL